MPVAASSLPRLLTLLLLAARLHTRAEISARTSHMFQNKYVTIHDRQQLTRTPYHRHMARGQYMQPHEPTALCPPAQANLALDSLPLARLGNVPRSMDARENTKDVYPSPHGVTESLNQNGVTGNDTGLLFAQHGPTALRRTAVV